LNAGEIVIIIGAAATPFLAAWNSWQATQIKKLKLQMETLCETCIYDYTPKNQNFGGDTKKTAS